MSFAIWGFGTALPESSVGQDQAAELINRASGHDAGQSRRVEAVHRRAGVGRRHLQMLDHIEEILEHPGGAPGHTMAWRMARYDEGIRNLSLQASYRALESAGVAAGEITHLVTVSCTGFAAPGFDLALFSGLGLDPGVQRTHVGFMGCHGALNGLRVANAFATSSRSSRVLVCAAELPSLHFRYEPNPRLAVVNALFGDGAGAVVGASSPAPGDESQAWRLVASGSTLVPGSEDAMSWRLGDRAFEMTLSPEVPALIGENLRPWLQTWLADQGLTMGGIASWAIHPGGPRILDAVEAALELPRSATSVSREVLAEFGNMSSPTILFILDRLQARQAPRPCVSLGFGPGLVIEAAIFL